MSFQETRCRKNFYNQVKLSGRIPQICLLFGPSAAGGAYIPAFCDIVVMVDGNASMYLGSPRMAEMVIGEKCPSKKWEAPVCIAQSQVMRRYSCKTEEEAIRLARAYLSYFPANYQEKAPMQKKRPPKHFDIPLADVIPQNQNAPLICMS